MQTTETKGDTAGEPAAKPKRRRPRRWRRIIGVSFLALVVLLVAARLALPPVARWYVNRALDQNPLYHGKIGQVEIRLLHGAYSINDVRLLKTTGTVARPFFAARRVNIELEWSALWQRKVVGRVVMVDPQVNFVDTADASTSQSGAGGPWLKMINDLSPFRINSAVVRNGQIHFVAPDQKPPVDVYLSHLDATVDNLTNIRDEAKPLVTTVNATALAMEQARLEYKMSLDPFSYHPTYQLAVRLLGLDVTKVNDLARAYGGIDFETGWFDLVVELDSKEGTLQGYVKPLFRDLTVFGASDLREDNPLEAFWEAVVGTTERIFRNQPRKQFGTEIPITGGPTTGSRQDVLAAVGNVLRNAFVRAYLPRLQGVARDIDGLTFGRGSIVEPTATGGDQ